MKRPEFAIVGAKELQETLRALAPKESKRIFKRAATAFAATVRDAVRSVEGVDQGWLKKGTKSKSTRSGGAVVFVDRILAPHGHIHRRGTKKRTTGKGLNRGTSPANKRMDMVLENASNRFLEHVGVVVLKEIKRQVAKRAAR